VIRSRRQWRHFTLTNQRDKRGNTVTMSVGESSACGATMVSQNSHWRVGSRDYQAPYLRSMGTADTRHLLAWGSCLPPLPLASCVPTPRAADVSVPIWAASADISSRHSRAEFDDFLRLPRAPALSPATNVSLIAPPCHAMCMTVCFLHTCTQQRRLLFLHTPIKFAICDSVSAHSGPGIRYYTSPYYCRSMLSDTPDDSSTRALGAIISFSTTPSSLFSLFLFFPRSCACPSHELLVVLKYPRPLSSFSGRSARSRVGEALVERDTEVHPVSP